MLPVSTHTGQRLELRLPATPGLVPRARQAVAGFAQEHGAACVPEIALAVSEAITNAVLHAYRDGSSGAVRVVACAEPERLVVVVRDYGVGMSPRLDSPGLGMGLSIIGRLTTRMNIERPDDGGTRLRMQFGLTESAL